MTLSACGGGAAPQRTASATSTATVASRSDTPAAAPSATPSAEPSPEPGAAATEPAGFPLDPELRTDRVVGAGGERRIEPGQGPGVRAYSERDQSADDPLRANASGWNCRVHVEYEGTPAADWYVQPGAAVRATMDGEALLILNTWANAFDYYGVAREPYLGDPDRARAPLAPFPGPGGGMGVYVAVVNDVFRTDYGHLDLDPTIAAVPEGAFVAGFTRGDDYRSRYATPRDYRAGDIVARWGVRRGDVLGFSGDSGYSEAPHLHYQITRRADGARLCPTAEPGFEDGGWLFR